MEIRTTNKSQKQYKVPNFLLKKPQIQQKRPAVRPKSKSHIIMEFQQLTVRDENSRAMIQKRVKMWIKNTPKIIIKSENPQYLRYQYQCPKKPLMEHLKLHSKMSQIEKTLQIVEALYQLAQTYGYFYCDKQMLRISTDGTPVVWMHQNFSACQRQFPIVQSPVAELIFLKKIKTTLNQIFQFPKNISIETKNQLVSFLEEERKKISTSFNRFPLLPLKKLLNQETPIIKSTKTKFSSKNLNSFKSISPGTHKYLTPNRYQRSCCAPSIKDLAKGIRNGGSYLKKKSRREQFQRSRQRVKTVLFQKAPKIYNIDEDCRAQKSEKRYQDIASFPQTEDFFWRQDTDQHIITKFNMHPQGNGQVCEQLKQQTSHKKFQNEGTVNQQFNFQQQEVSIIQKRQSPEKKNRKQSADVYYIKGWEKTQAKNQEKAFQNSTFSTRVTFSSVRGELECTSDLQKSQSKVEIPHLYPTSKDKQTKQKLLADLKRVMRESGLIAEQDSFEHEVDNLFQSQLIINKLSKPKLKQSELAQEFEKLFDSRISSQKHQSSIIADFEKILFQ